MAKYLYFYSCVSYTYFCYVIFITDLVVFLLIYFPYFFLYIESAEDRRHRTEES